MALPTPTAAAATLRYPPFGLRKWIWSPTISNINSPTSAELTAGTEWSGQISAQNGFDFAASTIDTPDAGSSYTTKVSGRVSSSDSSLTFYMSTSSSDARTTFTVGTIGYLSIAYEGIGAGTNKMDVFKCQVLSQTKSSDIEAPATLEVQFAIIAQPALNVSVPTA